MYHKTWHIAKERRRECGYALGVGKLMGEHINIYVYLNRVSKKKIINMVYKNRQSCMYVANQTVLKHDS